MSRITLTLPVKLKCPQLNFNFTKIVLVSSIKEDSSLYDIGHSLQLTNNIIARIRAIKLDSDNQLCFTLKPYIFEGLLGLLNFNDLFLEESDLGWYVEEYSPNKITISDFFMFLTENARVANRILRR